MLKRYWEIGPRVAAERIDAIFHGHLLNVWQRYRDEYHVGQNQGAAIQHMVQVTAAAIRSNRAGRGPFVCTEANPQEDVLKLIDFPRQGQYRPPEPGERSEHVGAILSGPRLLDFQTIQASMPGANNTKILAESLRFTYPADMADANDYGFRIIDPETNRAVLMYEKFQIGRWAPPSNRQAEPKP